MFNSIRAHQYINDFMRLINSYYRFEFTIILTTYYLFDSVNSVYDKDVLTNGAYERIGDLSGYRWIKINYFPVAYTQQTNPKIQQNNYGVNKATETQSVFPKINFTPTMLDMVSFTIDNSELENVYQVSSYEESFLGELAPIYKITLKEQYFDIADIEKQTDRVYAYTDITDKIYEPTIYNKIILATTQLNTISTTLLSNQEQSSGFLIV